MLLFSDLPIVFLHSQLSQHVESIALKVGSLCDIWDLFLEAPLRACYSKHLIPYIKVLLLIMLERFLFSTWDVD